MTTIRVESVRDVATGLFSLAIHLPAEDGALRDDGAPLRDGGGWGERRGRGDRGLREPAPPVTTHARDA
ncbi:hypothetical protein ACE7GA_03530 [Roseomonas sp. CCTCC AB2023176]|uniref:hypothetical protein n=1 Tax=Roseomonas sp. CCTCC AB2023176 TaxID=3342640 RepID=UPI0035D86927